MMRLSEAIRLGSMSHPQTLERTFEVDFFGNICKTCAIGAAKVAMGISHLSPTDIDDLWPFTAIKIACPVCGEIGTLKTIIDLHIGAGGFEGAHGWTREAIADFVATIEPQDAPVEAPAVQREEVRA